jgi:hypothetical protein
MDAFVSTSPTKKKTPAAAKSNRNDNNTEQQHGSTDDHETPIADNREQETVNRKGAGAKRERPSAAKRKAAAPPQQHADDEPAATIPIDALTTSINSMIKPTDKQPTKTATRPAAKTTRSCSNKRAPRKEKEAVVADGRAPGADAVGDIEDAEVVAHPDVPPQSSNLKVYTTFTAFSDEAGAAADDVAAVDPMTASTSMTNMNNNMIIIPPPASYYQSDDENVILQLKVGAAKISDGNSRSDDSDDGGVPNAYNASMTDTFLCKPFALEASVAADGVGDAIGAGSCTSVAGATPMMTPSASATGAAATGAGSSARVVRLLMDFKEKSRVGEWPATTSVHCYWCCHKFNTVPYGLPVKYCLDRFQVVGCFCSLECAAAWNFASKESLDEIFERYALLNLLSSHVGYGRTVRPAPDRTSLAMFGGHMSIEDFREFCTSSRLLLNNFPPMVSLTQQVEEVCDSELRSEYKFVPLDRERVNKYQEKIKLRRTKPLVNFKNTLDSTMNLKYH